MVRVLVQAWGQPGGVLPGLLAAVDGQVHQGVAVVHGLDAAQRGPVGLEDLAAVAQVADQVHPAGWRGGGSRAARDSWAEYQGMSQPMKAR